MTLAQMSTIKKEKKKSCIFDVSEEQESNSY